MFLPYFYFLGVALVSPDIDVFNCIISTFQSLLGRSELGNIVIIMLMLCLLAVREVSAVICASECMCGRHIPNASLKACFICTIDSEPDSKLHAV